MSSESISQDLPQEV